MDPSFRPDNDRSTTAVYHPTFLYEMLWNFGGAALIIWVGKRFSIRPPGVFCLYVAIYCAGRIWWELLRVDPAHQFLGQRLNFWVALIVLIGSLAVFVWNQRRGSRPAGTPARCRARRAGARAGADPRRWRRARPYAGARSPCRATWPASSATLMPAVKRAHRHPAPARCGRSASPSRAGSGAPVGRGSASRQRAPP